MANCYRNFVRLIGTQEDREAVTECVNTDATEYACGAETLRGYHNWDEIVSLTPERWQFYSRNFPRQLEEFMKMFPTLIFECHLWDMVNGVRHFVLRNGKILKELHVGNIDQCQPHNDFITRPAYEDDWDTFVPEWEQGGLSDERYAYEVARAIAYCRGKGDEFDAAEAEELAKAEAEELAKLTPEEREAIRERENTANESPQFEATEDDEFTRSFRESLSCDD